MIARPHPWRAVISIAAIAGLAAVAFAPTTTKQGVDYAVSTYSVPLYAKALDFVQRDSSYARLVRRIVPDDGTPTATTLALFEWTRKNVRDTPPGFPVVDDHVAHIIIRGYGQADQKADVFTTLSTYAGVPAYWTWVGKERPYLVLSFAWLDRRWRVFDVEGGIVFRLPTGALAAVEDLVGDPSMLESVAADRVYDSRPYSDYFEGFTPPTPPDLLRAEQQMLWPRAFYRVKRLVGFGRREWQGP